MKPITAVLIGAGGRGMDSYAPYALQHPNELQFVGVADPDDARRQKFAALHNLPAERCFRYDHELLAQPQMADVALICTQDRQHYQPAIQAMRQGYHLLLEKPMTPDPRECIEIGEVAEQTGRICVVCHVLRYTEFFRAIKRILDEGRLGRLISIQHNENVAFWHQALSFVRGPWANSKESSPMILAKSCHDMDIILWLAGADCTHISSFGSLTHFRAENAPEGAPEFCQDGCPVEDECPWFAPAYYLNSEFSEWAYGVPPSADAAAKLKALRQSNHGRCVYRCNNDVVDHQVVNFEFANQVTGVFTMTAFTRDCSRTLKLMGTKGELRATAEGNQIEVRDFLTGSTDILDLSKEAAANRYGHGGGDYRIMRDLVKWVRDGDPAQALTSASISVQSHLMAFAAEQSRLERRVINLAEYAKTVKHG
jgi:predicted dehydrogenase